MGKMKEYAQDRGYLGCCDGINVCLDCDYAQQTSHYFYKFRPKLETWYNRIIKKSKKIKQKTRKMEVPF